MSQSPIVLRKRVVDLDKMTIEGEASSHPSPWTFLEWKKTTTKAEKDPRVHQPPSLRKSEMVINDKKTKTCRFPEVVEKKHSSEKRRLANIPDKGMTTRVEAVLIQSVAQKPWRYNEAADPTHAGRQPTLKTSLELASYMQGRVRRIQDKQ